HMIIILLLFWFLLSGQTSVFFIVSALFSVFAVFFIVRNLFNYSSWIIGIKIQWVIFILKLLKEIALSTLQVTRIIWT
ncbi:hypothetical protein, partial [Salmonella enterica]|uniref:hypothetical protein n=1 Tax=Salmonella enterica TaxID=28901 RepID=UPI003D2DB48B